MLNYILGSVKVAPVAPKIIEKMLKWYGRMTKGQRARAKKHVRCTSTSGPTETERKTENQMERQV